MLLVTILNYRTFGSCYPEAFSAFLLHSPKGSCYKNRSGIEFSGVEKHQKCFSRGLNQMLRTVIKYKARLTAHYKMTL